MMELVSALAVLPGGSSALILSGVMALVVVGVGRSLLNEQPAEIAEEAMPRRS